MDLSNDLVQSPHFFRENECPEKLNDLPQVTEPAGGSHSVSHGTGDFLLRFRILFISEYFLNSSTQTFINMYMSMYTNYMWTVNELK